MKRVSLLASLFAALGCVALQAQTTILSADIPFHFQVGNKEMPAGKYRVDYAPSQGLLALHSVADNKTAYILTFLSANGKAPETGGVLRFNRYGETCFLASVWMAHSESGIEVTKTSREKEIAKRVSSEQASVALNAGQ